MNTMECLPDNLRGTEFYQPTERGVEQRISQRLAEIRARRKPGVQGERGSSVAAAVINRPCVPRTSNAVLASRLYCLRMGRGIYCDSSAGNMNTIERGDPW